MPKPVQPVIGKCPCYSCGGVADVKRLKNGKELFLVCPECNPGKNTVIRQQGQRLQNHILDNAELYAAGAVPETKPEPKPETKPEPVPEPSPEKIKPSTGGLDDWF